MTKKNSLKKALITSALSMVLCSSMLVGTTYAWFTDSVTSTGNVIQTGTLDIEVEYTLDGENWANLDGAQDLFQKGLWEPGHTEIVVLKIKNTGSLALKYSANMNIVNETVGKTKDGKDIVLSDILTVSTTALGPFEADGDWFDELMLSSALSGVFKNGLEEPGYTATFKETNILYEGKDEGGFLCGLRKGQTAYVFVQVDMPETVGNEANAKDKDSLPSIEFGINVFATQLAYEKDSIDEKYDEDAPEVTLVNKPYYSNYAATEPYTVNGGGQTIVGEATSVDAFTWNGNIPEMSTIFSSENGSKVTVNDLTFTGTMSAIMLGHYQNATYNNYNTELNNVNVLDAEVVSFSSNISPAVAVYGTAVLNNCTITGTTLSELDTDPMWPVYDMAVVNFSTTTLNNTKVGSIYVWNQAKLIVAEGSEVETIVLRGNGNMTNDDQVVTVKAGATVDAIDLSAVTDTSKVKITIEEGATVGGFVDEYFEGVTFATLDAWQAAVANEGVTRVSDATALKTALENGEEVALTTDIDYYNEDPDKQLIFESENAIDFNGNGNTITVTGSDPAVGNHGYVGFVPTGAEKSATVSNLTVTGTGFVELGDYNFSGGTYVANNLVIENLCSTLANKNGSDTVGCAFMQYGNGTLNNCVMTGTTALIDGVKAYDAGFGNSTTTTINGGEYGVIRVWEQAHVTIKGAEIDTIDSRAITTRNLGMLTIGAGTHVGTINLIPGDYTPALTIEEGAIVEAIVYNGVTYTQAEWLAR